MKIRYASFKDTSVIQDLLGQVGYRVEYTLLSRQMSLLLSNPDHSVVVAEDEGLVVAFCSVHFLPQVLNDGDLAFINYLIVDEKVRRKGIGKALESHVVKLAWSRKCDRVQLHCQEWRAEARQFYVQNGYREYPAFYSKRIIHAE